MAEPALDPYATLELAPGADAAQVRAAYRRLARQHHPDLSDEGRATERMRRINVAWEILSNPARRARYDAEVAASRAPNRHWSGAPRQATWASPPPAWSAGTTTIPRYRPSAASYDDEDGPSWVAIVGLVLLVLVLGPLLFGVFPVPLFGLFVLIAARWATRHSD